MRPPTNLEQASDDASKVRLALLVSHEHPLYRLAEAIDGDTPTWQDAEFE